MMHWLAMLGKVRAGHTHRTARSIAQHSQLPQSVLGSENNLADHARNRDVHQEYYRDNDDC